jgi:hypothetical protein
MTIEFSLRRRANQSRYLAVLFVTVAVLILVGTYISLPLIVSRSLGSVAATINTNGNTTASISGGLALYCGLGIILFGVTGIAFACYLLARSAFAELELSARATSIADALCISGGSFESLEKAINVLLPSGGQIGSARVLSSNDMESIIELVKLLRKA